MGPLGPAWRDVRCELRKLLILTAISVSLLLVTAGAVQAIESELVLDNPAVQVSRMDGLEAVAFPAEAYSDLVIDDTTARMVLDTELIPADSHRLLGHGVKRVSWEPVANGLVVQIEFATKPEFYAVNATPGTEIRPGVPQVIAAFSFTEDHKRNGYPVMGTGAKTASAAREDEHGTYELPKFPPVKYSDARVTLNVHNTDFRDVLWLLSEIGNVSIVLDPYWDQEPTGSRRTPGGGASGNGGPGNSGPGYRPAGTFNPVVPREGTGNLSLNFVDVPFDTALELVLMAVDLVKVDYPAQH